VRERLLFLPGMLAGPIFFGALYALAPMIDGYSHVAQTVSEVGRQGSPAEAFYQIANVLVAACLLVFAWGLYRVAKSNDAAILPAVLVAFYAIALIGLGMFPTPHPLHNVFGLSMMIGYMAPLALSLSWRGFENADKLVRGSWIAFVLIAISIFLNLSPLFARDMYPLEYYGLVQRSLLVAFYGWCFYLGSKLFIRA
jgi:hypothetical membrane protein